MAKRPGGRVRTMKRLLCILSSLDAGGAETFLMKISRTLPPDEYQMDFIVSRDNGCYTQEVLDRGGKIHLIPMRTKKPVASFNGIRKIVKENRYQYVLKLGNTPLCATDLIAAKWGGAKVLAMRSCNALTNLSRKQKILDTVFRPILNCVANVKIAPSILAAEYTFGKKQVDAGKVELLHNGVDTNVYCYDEAAREKIRNEFSLDGKLVVGHVGRFSRQKNHAFLLEVFREIKKQQENAVLLLVGTGELEDKIRQQAKQLELEDAVVYAGVRSDVPRMLSAMDVFVVPSFYEGMPNTVIEAQATGLPCVIADTITKEANITGLVQYLPLTDSAQAWAEQALSLCGQVRKDTKQDFIANGYDIQSVSQNFVQWIFG